MGARVTFQEITAKAPPRHLVLHFDLNRTVVLNDSVKKQSSLDVLNILLAEDAWGFLEETPGATPTWKLHHDPESRLAEFRPTNAVTYLEALELVCPGKKEKKRREALASRFTEPGSPGEDLRPFFTSMHESLPVQNAADHTEACILPGFYHLLWRLWKRGTTFSVVFRTFGEDLGRIVIAFNNFCEGEHPQFPDVRLNGTDGNPDLRISEERTGSWFRADNGFCGLVWGDADIEKDLVANVGNDPDAKTLESVAQALNAKRPLKNTRRTVTSGLEDVAAVFRGLKKPAALALRDYFPHWSKHDRIGRAGKMFLVDMLDETRLDVFFDDNILETGDDTCIVDVRSTSGEEVPPVYAHRYYLIRADARAALLDVNWFLENLTMKVRCAEHRRKARVLWRQLWRSKKFERKNVVRLSIADLSPSGKTIINSFANDKESMRKRHQRKPSIRYTSDADFADILLSESTPPEVRRLSAFAPVDYKSLMVPTDS
jgi:hypothetical protein